MIIGTLINRTIVVITHFGDHTNKHLLLFICFMIEFYQLDLLQTEEPTSKIRLKIIRGKNLMKKDIFGAR
jgi:hypothetical protein